MADLLLRISELGVIDYAYFLNCNLEYENPRSIYTFLSADDSENIKNILTKKKKTHSFINVKINNQSFKIILQPLGSHYLFYATDLDLDKSHKTLIINILSVFSHHYSINNEIDRDDNQFIYNSIQKLNNQIVNKTRETEKLNQKLSKLNSILNDRLVSDPLTNLVSRYQYRDEIALALKNSTNNFALFWFIDIDDFKSINDTYGHNVGDKYLIEFANRIKKLSFENSVKMRIAGDEFGIFIPNIEDYSKENIDSFIEVFRDTVIHNIKIKDLDLPLKLSIGISVYNHDTNDIHQLIDFADFAMYQAKKEKNCLYKIFNRNDYENKKNKSGR
ncbi:MAG: GGDEF domain-containing protein [Candidatus Izimaplasma sp.]|nr:GGDEF domain-containing protein [Candidatus Izimaplasma bacterium]